MNKQYGAGVACSLLSVIEKEMEAVGAQHSAKGEIDKMMFESSERPERPGVLLDHIAWGKRFALHLSAIWSLEVYGKGIYCSGVCQ